MRVVNNINDEWRFTIAGKTENINLPHTWNNIDGQEGKTGYLRAKGIYEKHFGKTEGEVFLEVLGANSEATVFLNGEQLLKHNGGYSAFYVNLTDKLTKESNSLIIEVSNAPNDSVYPTMADFTFYGGLYRDVNLICFDQKAHFDITGNGKGIFVSPVKEDGRWYVNIKASLSGINSDDYINYAIIDKKGNVVATADSSERKTKIPVDSPQLWQGVKNPYLYTVRAVLIHDGEKVDMAEVETGFREIEISAENGFYLNGKHIKIKGVSRHQDRENIGNALTINEHIEDIKLIKEVGANSIRLAHYQQSQDFYSLCDREGLLVWAEVPVISRYNKKRQENAKNQLRELIIQSKNHPSIFCWGIANEITIAGDGKGVTAAIEELAKYSKSLDKSRYNTIAQVTMYPVDGQMNALTDIVGYNHYFGWYMGTFDELDKWLEKWHSANPDKKLCLSEYGAEGIVKYQGDNPTQGDYSEEYQAVFHENYLKRINAEDWIWGSYVWNMFDFGSAARNEGGVRGRNNKGLVTFDRKIKKDAFYLYKAFWSDELFVYIAGNRYNKRLIGNTTVKVYSNLPSVTLNVNGKIYTKQCDKIFVFDDLTIEKGKNIITAHAGNQIMDVTIEGVDSLPIEYALPQGETSMVRNWFGEDGQALADSYNPECFSLNDRFGKLLSNDEFKVLLKKFAGKKADSKLLYLASPFKLSTLINLPFVKINDEMKSMANRYLQTIKKKK